MTRRIRSKKLDTARAGRERGFSLVEMLMGLLILLIVMGAVMQIITGALANATVEQSKLDLVQEAREFMDQMSRDLHEAGNPSPRSVSASLLTASPTTNDTHAAVGLVKVAAGELWFEGDVDGQGAVSVIHYWLDPSTTGNCPCLRRSALVKVQGDPLAGQTTASWQVEVQNVKNTSIFSAYARGAAGTAETLPVDFTNNSDTIADIDTIQAVLTVESPIADPRTKTKPLTTFVSTTRLNNCSMAASGRLMSCF
jgi:prepilin-type N-terminal cleavage/methylation domain-containing protein